MTIYYAINSPQKFIFQHFIDELYTSEYQIIKMQYL